MNTSISTTARATYRLGNGLRLTVEVRSDCICAHLLPAMRDEATPAISVTRCPHELVSSSVMGVIFGTTLITMPTDARDSCIRWLHANGIAAEQIA